MRFRNHLFPSALIVLGSSLVLASPSSAQLYGPGTSSVSAISYVGAGNLSTDGSGNVAIWPTIEQYSSTGQAIDATGSQSFSGNDSQNMPQTMMLSGTGKSQADYGVLHAYAYGKVDNPYYNVNNPTYFAGFTNGGVVNPAGSPQYLQVLGQALFQDTLTLNPTSDPIVSLQYLFHVDGNITDSLHNYADLAFSAGSNSTVFATASSGSADWATPAWSVSPGNPISFGGTFSAIFVVNTNSADNPEGQTVSGTADFYNTLSLTSIQLLDANGNQVNGATYLTASGTHYDILGATYGAAVPEPGQMALVASLCLSGAALFRKRRRSRA